MKNGRLWFGMGMLACWTGGLAALAAVEPVRKSASPPGRPPAAAVAPGIGSLLAARCLTCHSDKAQMGGLRLDSRDAMLKGGKSGPAVVPGDPAKSPLIQAVHYDGKLKMPPAGKLKAEEIAALTRWIETGAVWPSSAPAVPRKAGGAARNLKPETRNPKPSPLWAFQPVQRPAVPVVKNRGWVKTPVDSFILAGLEGRGWAPSPYADRRTLIRRVTLDLIGLPPTVEEVEAFLADRAPDAWSKAVDRLLSSKQYGERMAQHWLDLARYADSDGYHDDTTRLMWRYRDYVIDSFNKNKPFDRFTVEQLAGDLLPNATVEQKTASAFNRCGPTTSEGGAVPEEVLAQYAIDRVNTTSGVWLGLTVQCAQCHDHKYDPVSARDYYQLFAFFNQVPEEALYRGTDAPPTILIPTPAQQSRLDELGGQIGALETELKSCMQAMPADPKRAEEINKKIAAAKAARVEIERAARLRVMTDVPQRRPTHILTRGDYRNLGPEVQPAAPAALGTLPAGMKADRLALANWLVDPKHPLTARVTVNRFWQMLFGAGLVKSSDDFGSRGDRPSHPELLDYLASEFVRSGWDVKHLLRLIVTSAAYQQSSKASSASLARDPANRMLARGPRFRLAAETVRDNALAISGLLDRERAVGGPSVKPYQPGDLWRELAAGDQAERGYVQDHGPDLYRRGIYTFWKRSILYPSFAVFDAPKREVCAGQRMVTNTPLQAFVTLNDVTYVEAARVFAQRILERGGVNFDTRLSYAYRIALARPPSARERKVLAGIHAEMLAHYRADADAALKLASTGEAPRPKELDPAEHAAWTCLCNAILNLDETITRE